MLKQHEPDKRVASELVERVVSGMPAWIYCCFRILVMAVFPRPLPSRSCSPQKPPCGVCRGRQSSSQIGDIIRFEGATLITPTEREAHLALRDFSSGLVVISEHCHGVSILLVPDSETIEAFERSSTGHERGSAYMAQSQSGSTDNRKSG